MQAAAALAHKDLRAALDLADALGRRPAAGRADRAAVPTRSSGGRERRVDDSPAPRWPARSACSSTAQLRPARSGRTFATVNPATEEVLGVVADGSPEDLDAAIAAARRAFDETDWSTDVGPAGALPAPAAGRLRSPTPRSCGP